MNKADLILTVSEKTGLTKKDVGAVVETTLETITQELAVGNPVKIVGFGNFVVRDRAARKGRNPQDGSEIEIPATKAPAFKAGKALKESVK